MGGLGSLAKPGRWKIVILLVAVVGLVGGSAVYYHKVLRWKRFAEVENGVLYRSGYLRDHQLEAAIKKHQIKTVFSLTFTNNANEQAVCDRLGVKRQFYYMHGDGIGTDDAYLRFLQEVQNPANHPMLVHCSAGVQRTGGAVALYRTVLQGWDFQRAIDEMIAFGNDGLERQIQQLRRIDSALKREKPTSGLANQPKSKQAGALR